MSRAADVLLADGTTVHLRQISPDDADAVVAMHGRFSDRTRYLRYFSPYPRIPARDLARFVTVDHVDREALVIAAGQALIGVGRYERYGPDSPIAEVAFVVEDAYQGRGVGSVLLEHLAAAAHEVGIEQFVAEVLPSNATMLNVFTGTGYEVTRRYADGVVHLAFPVEPTPRSLAVQWDREHRTEARSVARLLRPASIAVYGASSTGRGVGAAVLAHLRAGGFPGPIIPVRPGSALRDLCSARIDATETSPAGAANDAEQRHPDLAVVAVPPSSIRDVVADAAAAGVHGLLVITELDPAQRRDLLAHARTAGMRVIGPGSLGMADHTAQLNATLVPRLPKAGRVGLFCQSGTLGLPLLAEADRRGIGISSFVSVGRRTDVSGNDLLQFWADDPETDMIAMYLETFGNPRKFDRIARTIGRRKPIVVLAPNTAEPMEALRAHSGVIEVGTVAELFDVVRVLDGRPLPAGDRIGVVSNAFALAALASARVKAAGLSVGRTGSVGPNADPAELAAALRTTLDSDDADAVIVVVTPPLPAGALVPHETSILLPYMKALAEVAESADKPVVVTSLPGEAGPIGVPAYRSVEEAVRALAHAVRRAAWLRLPTGRLPEPIRAEVSTLAEALAAYAIPVKSAGEGVACVIEVRDDPGFGPVVGFGLGGPVTELLGDRAWRAAPLTDLDAKALVRAPKAAPLLAGADLDALAELLVRVGQLADEIPGLRRLVLNPVLAHETGWTILHAEGELDDPAQRPDSGPRRL